MDQAQYIKKLKFLIKKYHPDTCQDENLQPLFTDITVKLNQKLDQARSSKQSGSGAVRCNKNVQPGQEYTLVSESDQAYAYYKQGIKFYKNIHPGQFYMKKNSAVSYEHIHYEEQLKVLEKIFISFRVANYFFRKVAGDYPDSAWAEDAKNKIQLLQKLWKSYESRTAEKNPSAITPEQLNAFMRDTGISFKQQ